MRNKLLFFLSVILLTASCKEQEQEGHEMPGLDFKIDDLVSQNSCETIRKRIEEGGANNEELHYRLAECAFQKDSLDAALNAVNKALEMQSINAAFIVLKSRILHKKGELAAAIREAENAQALDADSPGFYVYMGQLYLEADSLNLVKEYLVEANSMAPDWKPIVQLKARYYLKKGELEQSLTESKKALTKDIKDPVSYSLISEAYLASGKRDSAARYVSQGLQLSGYRDPSLLNQLASILVNSGKEDSAVAVYKKAIALSPGQKKSYQNLGDLYMRRGYFSEAFFAFSSYSQAYPTDTAVYLKQGYCLEKLGDYVKAREVYTRAYNRFPEYKEFLIAKNKADNILTRTYSGSTLQ
jgi:tetratricopeptide (TPR) repeat protein